MTFGPVDGVPVLVHAARTRVCCVGGGPVAAAKIAGLVDGGAVVRVVAPEVAAPVREEVDAGRLTWIARAYRSGDIGDAHLVIAGTATSAVNARVAADADAAGRLCVRVDRTADLSPGATASFMAAVRRDPLVLAVSTSGAAPALTRMLRAELEHGYGPEWAQLAALCGELRDDPEVSAALAATDPDERRARWRALYHSDILDLIRSGSSASARKAAYACLLSSSA